MAGLNKTKTELSSLQDALAKTQVDLEKTNFELHAKKSRPHLTLTSRLQLKVHVSPVDGASQHSACSLQLHKAAQSNVARLQARFSMLHALLTQLGTCADILLDHYSLY